MVDPEWIGLDCGIPPTDSKSSVNKKDSIHLITSIIILYEYNLLLFTYYLY